MPSDELTINKVDMIGEAIIDRGMEWIHLPIKDMNGPDISFDNSWIKVVQNIVDRIQQGEHILVHCKGGLGRSGTIAALLLIELGIPNDKAIIQVRIARPGAIDIADQEKYILQYSPLTNPTG
jgi:ADP-ribosyl-[dinitrogen reductase] hydrolase